MVDKNRTVSTIKHHRKNNFVMVDHTIVDDPRISWKAKGLMLYLLKQADGWQFYESEIATHAKDGRESTSNGLLELEKYGYLVRSWVRDDKGRYIGRNWDIYETPINNSDSRKADYGKPETGQTHIGKPATNNNNGKNKNNKNNNTNQDKGCDDVKEIMEQYDIKISDSKTIAILSRYSASQLNKIGNTLKQKKNEGLILNPAGMLVKKCEAVCNSILDDEDNFYPSPNKKEKNCLDGTKKYQNEGEFYVLPDELARLQN